MDICCLYGFLSEQMKLTDFVCYITKNALKNSTQKGNRLDKSNNRSKEVFALKSLSS